MKREESQGKLEISMYMVTRNAKNKANGNELEQEFSISLVSKKMFRFSWVHNYTTIEQS